MPRWDWKCQERGKAVELTFRRKPPQVRCSCGGVATSLVPTTGLGTRFPITLEHIDVETGQPKTFNSATELRRYCRKHGLGSGALL